MKSTACQSYKNMTRRGLLQAGGAASVATMFGVPIRELMANIGKDGPVQAEQVVMLWMSGGMTHIDTFDPKPGRPTAGEFEPIKTSSDEIQVSEILPTMAKHMDKATIVRSIMGEEGAHGRASFHLQTAYKILPQIVTPGIGSTILAEKGRLGDLPGFITINGRAPSAGYLGQRADAYYIGQAGQPDPYLSVPTHLNEHRINKRLEILARMNKRYEQGTKSRKLEDVDRTYLEAKRFMNSPALEAFDIEKESPAVREAYGDTNYGRGVLLARRLLETGVRFVQVNLGGFDTHGNNFESMRALGGIFDPAIGNLLGDLKANGMIDKTIVMVLSEFGRTPRINGNAGRDHYPKVFSSMVAGGPFGKGRVWGSSGPDGTEADEHPVKVGDLHATVLSALGINPQKERMTPLGRAMPLVQNGETIRELIA